MALDAPFTPFIRCLHTQLFLEFSLCSQGKGYGKMCTYITRMICNAPTPEFGEVRRRAQAMSSMLTIMTAYASGKNAVGDIWRNTRSVIFDMQAHHVCCIFQP